MRLRLLLLVALALPAGLAPQARAQGTVQIDVIGVEPVLETPFVSELAARFETGRYPVRIVYSAPTQASATFRIEARLARDGQTIAQAASEPFGLAPGAYTYLGFDAPMGNGPPVRFAQTLASLVDALPREDREAVRQTGALAEGVYALELAVVPDEPSSLIVSLPATVVFQVRLAQPPVLFEPADAATVTALTPVFTWTPVVAGAGALPEYDFLLVEMLPGQTALQALQGNRAYHEETVLGTTLLYTPEKLPLEAGAAYAWQVLARDAAGLTAFRNEGLSRAGSFVYAPVTLIGQMQQPVMLTSPIGNQTLDDALLGPDPDPEFRWEVLQEGADQYFEQNLVSITFLAVGGPAYSDMLTGGGDVSFTVQVPPSVTGATRAFRFLPTFNRLRAGVDYNWFLSTPDRQISGVGSFRYRPGQTGGVVRPLLADLMSPRAGETVTRLAPSFLWTTAPRDAAAVQSLELVLEQGGTEVVRREVRVQRMGLPVAHVYMPVLTADELLALETGRGRGADLSVHVEVNGQAGEAERRTFTYRPELGLVPAAPAARSTVAGPQVELAWRGALPAWASGRSDLRLEAVVLTGTASAARVPLGLTDSRVAVDLDRLAQQNPDLAPAPGKSYRWRLELTNGQGWTARGPMASFSAGGPQVTLTAPAAGGYVEGAVPSFAWQWQGSAPPPPGAELVARNLDREEALPVRVPLAAGATGYTLTAEQAVGLGTGEVEWTVEVDGRAAAPPQRFTYYPLVPIAVSAPSEGATIADAFVDVAWNVELPNDLAGEPLELVARACATAATACAFIDSPVLSTISAAQRGRTRLPVVALGTVDAGRPATLSLYLRSREGGERWSSQPVDVRTDLRFEQTEPLVRLTAPAAGSTNGDPLVTFEWELIGPSVANRPLVLAAQPFDYDGVSPADTFSTVRIALPAGTERYTPTGEEQLLLGAGDGMYVLWHLEAEGYRIGEPSYFANRPRVDLALSGLADGRDVRGDRVEIGYSTDLPPALRAAGVQLTMNGVESAESDPFNQFIFPTREIGALGQPSGTISLDVAQSATLKPDHVYFLSFGAGVRRSNTFSLGGTRRPDWMAEPAVEFNDVTFREAAAPTLLAPVGEVDDPLFAFRWRADERIRARRLEVVVVPVDAQGQPAPARTVRFEVPRTRDTELALAPEQAFQIETAYQALPITGDHAWHLEADGRRITEPAAFRYVPTFVAPLTRPQAQSTVPDAQVDIDWRVEVPPGLDGTPLAASLAMRQEGRSRHDGYVQVPLGTVTGSYSASTPVDVRALPLDPAAGYALGILVRRPGQPDGWTATSYDPVRGVRFAAAQAPVATLTSPEGPSSALEPFFMWSFETDAPAGQTLFAVVRPMGGGPAVVREAVARRADGSLPTTHRLSPQASMQLAYGSDYQATLEMGGLAVSNALAFSYAPELLTLDETYPTVDALDALVGPLPFAWQLRLPDEQVPRFVAAGAQWALRFEQGDAVHVVPVGLDAPQLTYDLAELRAYGFAIDDVRASIRWSVVLTGPGSANDRWQARSGGTVFQPGPSGITFTTPAGSDPSVDELLPLFEWTSARPLTDAHALALRLTPRDDAQGSPGPLLADQAVTIPLPPRASRHALTPEQAMALPVASRDGGLAGRTVLASLLVGGVPGGSVEFYYSPMFGATLQAPQQPQTIGDTTVTFRWSAQVPQTLYDAGALPTVGLRKVQGERRLIGFAARDSLLATPQRIAALEGPGFALVDGDFYEWYVGLANASGTWNATSLDVMPVAYRSAPPRPPAPAPYVTLTAPDSGIVATELRPTFRWRYDGLPPGVDASALRASLVFTARTPNLPDGTPTQTYHFVDVGAGETSYRLDPQLTALAPGVVYEWTVTLVPNAASQQASAPLLDADRLESAPRTFAYQSAPPDRGGWDGFLTRFAELIGFDGLIDADGDGDLDGQAAVVLATDPAQDAATLPERPADPDDGDAGDSDAADPADDPDRDAPPPAPQTTTVPVAASDVQTVTTAGGDSVVVGGTLAADLDADPDARQRLSGLAPVPGLELTRLEWRRADGAVTLPEADLQALRGLTLADLRGLDLGEIVVGARLSLGRLEGFDCGAGPGSTLELGEAALTLRPSGTVEGAFAATLDCQVAVGPFTARLSSATLSFAGGSDGQRARLDAQAQLEAGGQTFTGALGVNLITGAITDLSFALDRPFVWYVPEAEPALAFAIERAEIDREGLLIDGRNALLLGAADDPNAPRVGVTFDALRVDLATGAIASGSILFDQRFAFEVGLSDGPALPGGAPGPDQMRYRAVPATGVPAGLQSGLYVELGSQLSVDRDGLTVSGEGGAVIRAGELAFEDSLTVRYDDGFAFGIGTGFGISDGQMTFDWRGAQIAYADPSGFHLDRAGLVAAALPDTLVLPARETAYVVIKDAQGTLLVDHARAADGTLRLTTRQPLPLVLPALAGAGGVAPTLTVTFADLGWGGGAVTSGLIEAAVPPQSPGFDLALLGVPMAVRHVRYAGDAASSPDGLAGLSLSGALSLFGQVPSEQNTFALQIGGGRAAGQLALATLDGQIDLVAGGRAALELASVQGPIDVPLAPGGGAPTVDLDLGVAFVLQDPTDGSDAVRADLAASYELDAQGDVDFSAGATQPVVLTGTDPMTFGPVAFAFDRIEGLTLGYTSAGGFTFEAGLDTRLALELAGADTLVVPLDGLVVSERGLTIPEQTVDVTGVAFEMSGASLRLLALHTGDDDEPTNLPGVTWDWYAGTVDLSGAFVPVLDFEVRLPSFYGVNPNDPGAPIVFNGVTYRDGLLEGAFAYTPALDAQGDPDAFATVPLGPPAMAPPALAFEQVAGAFVDRGGRQGLDLDLTGYLVPGMGPFAPSDPAACSLARFELGLVQGPGLEGTVTAQDAGPCGQVQFGPVTLEVLAAAQSPAPSTLTFAYAGGQQQARFTGGIRATLPAPATGGNAPAFDGTLTLDLLTGEVSDGQIQIAQPFTVPIPLQSADPLFSATLTRGLIDKDGLTLDGSGSFLLDQGAVGVGVDSLRMRWRDGRIDRGSATLSAGIALESQASPLDWRAVPLDPDALTLSDVPDGGFRMDLQGAVMLDADGLHVTGAGRAGMRMAGFNSPAVRIGFANDQVPADGLTIGLGPVAITDGRAEFFFDLDGRTASTPLATLDRDGWTFSGQAAVESVIPDTLMLPSVDVAYVVLRDAQGTLLVDRQPGRIETVSQQTVRLSIPALGIEEGASNPPIDIAFSAAIDDAGNVVADSVAFSFGGQAMPLAELPLALRSGSYVRARANPFGVEADVLLPDVLDDPAQPLAVYLEVGPDGFEGTAEAGTFSRTFDPQLAAQAPVVQRAFGQGGAAIAVRGVRLAFSNNAPPDIQLSGDLTADLLQAKDASGNPTGQPAYLHWAADYASPAAGQPADWRFDASAQHLGDVPLGVATLEPAPVGGLSLTYSRTGTTSRFDLEVAGILRMGELLDGFALEVQAFGLAFVSQNGNRTVQASIDASNGTAVNRELFGQLAVLDIPVGGVALAASPDLVTVTVNQASLTAVSDDPMGLAASGMALTSDGDFSFQQIAVGPVPIVGDYAYLDELALSKPTPTARVEIAVTGAVQLPDPFGPNATSSLSVTIARPQGAAAPQIDVTGITFASLGSPGPNGDPLEVSLGGFATLEPTGLALDLNLNDQSKSPTLYATGAIYVNNDAGRLIEMGKASDPRQHYGLKVGRAASAGDCSEFFVGSACVGYRLSVSNAGGAPLFDFETDFFAVSVQTVSLASTDASPFTVAIDGQAGLNIAGVGGRADFEEFTFDRTGIVSSGRLANGARFFLLGDDDGGLFKLEVGAYVTARDTTISVTGGSTSAGGGGASPSVSESQLLVSRYLRFGGQGFDALSVYIGGDDFNMAAGVEEVLYYKTPGGETTLKIVNAGLELPSLALNAYFEYQGGGGDGALVRIAGRGAFGPPPTAKEVAAVGKFSNKGGQLSFGVFVAATASIPIIPGIVELSGVGGGFFLRPDRVDLDLVTNAVDMGTGGFSQRSQDVIRAQREPALRRVTEDGTFAILLYAGAGLIGTEGLYALDGKALLNISDEAVILDATVGIFGFAPHELGAALNVNVAYNPAFVSGAVVAAVKVPSPRVLDVEGRLSFYAGRGAGGADAWGIAGDIDGKVVSRLAVSAELFLGPPGFYFAFDTGFDVDLWIIEFGASFELEVWRIRKDDSFGAYAAGKAYMETRIGGASAGLKGAYVKDRNGRLIYGSARAENDYLPDITGWGKAGTGGLDAGLGRGPYWSRVAAARAAARDMFAAREEAKQRMEDTERALKAAAEAQRQRDLMLAASAGVSADTIEKSGLAFYTLPKLQREIVARQALSALENTLWLEPSGVPTVLLDVYENALVMDFTPNIDPDAIPTIAAAKQAAIDAVDQASATAGPVITRLQATQNELELAISDAEQSLEAMQSFTSPVTKVGIGNLPTLSPDGTIIGQPTFSVDETQVAQQRQTIAQAEAEVAALDAQYREALVKTLDELAKADLEFNGEVSFDYAVGGRAPGAGGMTSFTGGATSLTPIATLWSPPTALSVNEAARDFRNAIEKLNRYDAEVAQALWGRSVTALAYKQQFVDNEAAAIRSAIDAQIDRVMAATAGNQTPFAPNGANPWQEAAWAARSAKYATLFALDGSQAVSESARTAAGMSDRAAAQNNRDDYSKAYKMHLTNFWLHFPRLGLQRVADELGEKARELGDDNDRSMEPLLAAYAGFTDEIDRFYSLKAELATVAYGMADDYRGWLAGNAAGQSTGSGLTLLTPDDTAFGLPGEVVYARGQAGPFDLGEVMTSLETSLEPPTLAFMNVDQNQYNWFSSYVRVSFGAQAPAGGDVVEYSYAIDRGGRGSIYAADQFYTAGNLSVLTFRPYKTSVAEQEHAYTLTVRARSAGGLVAIRQGAFTARVDPGGTSSGTGDIEIDDTSPPTVSLVEVRPYRVVAGDTIRYGRRSANRLYLSSLDGVAVHARAYDAESDVRLYEYALGTSLGATDLQPFRPLVGTRDAGTGSYVNTSIDAVLRTLALPDGGDAYLTVRATNGEGLSGVAFFNRAIRYDSTPPPALELETVTPAPSAQLLASTFGDGQSGRSSGSGGGGLTLTSGSVQASAPLALAGPLPIRLFVSPTTPPTHAPPRLLSPSINADGTTPERSLAVSWRHIGDPESGRLHYEYALSTEAEAVAAFADPLADRGTTDRTRVLFDSSPLSFVLPRYVHVRAVNGAGAAGPVQTLPVVALDTTTPTAPSAQLVPRSDELQLWLTQYPVDDQTTVRGYQLAWGTTPTNFRLRPFADLDEQGRVPLDYFSLDANGNRRRVLGIDKANLPQGVPIYVGVRAVNGQGAVSSVAVSGPVTLGAPPAAPSVQVVAFDTEEQNMRLLVGTLTSPTGVVRASYRVREVAASTLMQTGTGRTGVLRGFGASGGTRADVEGTLVASSSPRATVQPHAVDVALREAKRRFGKAPALPPGELDVARSFDVTVSVTGSDGATTSTTVRYDYVPPSRFDKVTPTGEDDWRRDAALTLFVGQPAQDASSEADSGSSEAGGGDR